MQVRNSSIGKLVINSDRNDTLPTIGQLNYIPYYNSTYKGGVGQREIPEIISTKKVIVSPPQTEFRIQDYPLKRMQRGMSGWDWQTEISEEEDLFDKAHSCKPKYSTFNKLFPSRNFGMYPVKRNEKINITSEIPPIKEYNRRLDRLSEYRENMLKVQREY